MESTGSSKVEIQFSPTKTRCSAKVSSMRTTMQSALLSRQTLISSKLTWCKWTLSAILDELSVSSRMIRRAHQAFSHPRMLLSRSTKMRSSMQDRQRASMERTNLIQAISLTLTSSSSSLTSPNLASMRSKSTTQGFSRIPCSRPIEA